jgi:c-di-GMP-binding flagellar brake protein YcgR
MGLLDMFRRKDRPEGARTFDIEKTEEVRSLIGSLCEQQESCEFLIGEELFSSIFLRLDEEDFLTDLMIPLAGNTLLREGQGIHIGFLRREIPYSMNCVYRGRRVAEGYEALAFSVPTVLRYSNRRFYYRVNPSNTQPVRVLFDLGLSQVMDALVENISGGGIAVRSNLTNLLRPGVTIDRVDVIMPSGEWISCQGQVTRLQGKLIGIKLEGISFKDRRSIIRYVAERQQDEISRTDKED